MEIATWPDAGPGGSPTAGGILPQPDLQRCLLSERCLYGDQLCYDLSVDSVMDQTLISRCWVAEWAR
jgi:hypothetical protein